jgi:phosphinothricin acetyltransferase
MIRDATLDDATACAAIYAPYVRETAITFETEPPGAGEMGERIASSLSTHAFVVLEEGDRVVGYAYAGQFHRRAAYRWACEVSVYLEQGATGRGTGRALYTALFDRLEARGFRMLISLMTVPNEASLRLHLAMDFEVVGTMTEIGYKLGAWHDVMWLQRRLPDIGDPPPEPH